jgi:hypothetical protein
MPSELDSIFDAANEAMISSVMGEVAEVAHGAGAYYEVRGIWSDPIVDGDQELGILGSFGARLSTLDQVPARGDKLRIGVTEYRVVSVQVDSTGWVRMGLHR